MLPQYGDARLHAQHLDERWPSSKTTPARERGELSRRDNTFYDTPRRRLQILSTLHFMSRGHSMIPWQEITAVAAPDSPHVAEDAMRYFRY